MVATENAEYRRLIERRCQWGNPGGFTPDNLPDHLYDFQKHLVEWSLHQGRSAIFADCGLGKTAMQLVWADEIIRRHNKPVLIVTPLAVGQQTVREAERIGVSAARVKDGQCQGLPMVYVTNYEQLHKFDASMFVGVVCDESSAIKDAQGVRKDIVVDFLRTVHFRLLCTATAAPNDYEELGTSSEALGLLGYRDMITKFFKMEQQGGHRGWGRTKYRFRGHAEQPFWSWVTSWARSLKKPSDLGFSDDRYHLPPLHEKEIVVKTAKLRKGCLFATPAVGLREESEERRISIQERCQKAIDLSHSTDEPFVMWCERNEEGDTLEKMSTDCVQVTGSMSDEAKEEALTAFSSGQIKRLIIKPKIGAWGLNWQHCSNTCFFPSHSFEQYYQAVRRFYRFGQKSPVNVSLIVTEGERGIINNLERKKMQADQMFSSLCQHMKDSIHLTTQDHFPEQEKLPSWL